MNTQVKCISADQYSNSMSPIQLQKTTINFSDNKLDVLSLAILTDHKLEISIYNEENNRIKLTWEPTSSFPFLYNIPLYSSKNVFIKISCKHDLLEDNDNTIRQYSSQLDTYKYVLFYNNQEQRGKSEKKIKINLQDEQILSIIQNSEYGNVSLNIDDDEGDLT